MRTLVWWLIRLYQFVFSGIFGRQCRFEPTCSHYMQQAVMVHGVTRGVWLGLKRIGRCGPGGGYGFDPVPPLCKDAPALAASGKAKIRATTKVKSRKPR